MSFWKSRPKSKYGSKRVESSGYSFASKAEAGLYTYLQVLEKLGEIKIIKTQARVTLIDGSRDERIEYYADFLVFDNQLKEEVWCEMKGFETDVWRLKRKLWKRFGPGLLRVYKGSALRISLYEELRPKVKP